jgi:hypothetical protein
VRYNDVVRDEPAAESVLHHERIERRPLKRRSAMKTLRVVCLLTLTALSHVSTADCVKNQYGDVVCGKGQCAADQYGKVFCAKEGGGALRDRYGNVKCGSGYCAMDDLGQIQCSTTPGGSAATDSYGKVKCLGGCQAASLQLCEAAR